MKIASYQSRGFTLIEILVVVIILGITSALIIPSIGSRDDLKAAAGARSVVSDLVYAQNRAIATQAMHYVKFETVEERYSILTALPSTYVTHPITKGNFITQFEEGAYGDITISGADFDTQKILAFDELGVPYGVTSAGVATALVAEGELTVTCGDVDVTITVEPYTGEIQVD
jgi:prepilin-type N-terminal cleavage/methylation domain-containing protein